MTPLLIALALTAQYRQCQTAATYRAYQAPTVYAYAAPYVQNYVDKTAFVAVEHDGYYVDLIGGRQRAEGRAQAALFAQTAIVDQLTGIRTELAALKLVIAAGKPLPVDPGTLGPPVGNPVPPPPDKGPPIPPPSPQPPTTGPPIPPSSKPVIDDATAKVWTDQALTILSARCSKCHTAGSNPKGNFIIFDAAGKLALASPASYDKIGRAVFTAKMPPAKPLNDTEYSALNSWISLHDEEINAYLASLEALKSTGAVAPPPPLPATPPGAKP